ncbi:MAG: CapA family protein, partial [Caldilineales bacterium]|nr:CapA family protein [Caldilineales bacterium]
MRFIRPLILTFVLLLMAACVQATPEPAPLPNPTLPAAPTVEPIPGEPTPDITPTQAPSPTPVPPPTPSGPIPIVFSANIPAAEIARLRDAVASASELPNGRAMEEAGVISDAVNTFLYQPWAQANEPILADRVFAVVAPFATVQDDITMAELRGRWSGETQQPLFVSEDAAIALGPVFESLPAVITPTEEIPARLAETPGSLAIFPFDQLHPTLKVISVDGVNPLSNQLDPATYPLAVRLSVIGPDAESLAPLFTDALPRTNRDASRLTTLIMTGVTAMSRGTAEKMEEKGYTYPADVISGTLAAADITHVSNEVPFIDGCKVNNTFMNLTLCSDYPYWQALEAIGTDIVGLSGNHVNDFGREGALESLQFYRDRQIPIYGSGLNEAEACEPLLWEDHGNRFAFIAALAWWPDTAWATETEPGACYFYDNHDRILADIARLKKEVDVVAVELQYHETYNPWPIPEQVEEFRALRQAGADIVTGVQSHVPQAWEPDPDGIIVYGLGNLFFDQMEAWETRTGLIARHTLYDGRLISSEILTTVLEDFAQPRWATSEERTGILESIFAATPDRNPPPAESEPAQPEPEPVTSASSGQPGLAAPAPADQPQEHYLLARPFAPDAQQL